MCCFSNANIEKSYEMAFTYITDITTYFTYFLLEKKKYYF